MADPYHYLDSDSRRSSFSRDGTAVATPQSGTSPNGSPPLSPRAEALQPERTDDRRRSAGNHRPSNRVKFTVGGDNDESSDSEEDMISLRDTVPQMPAQTHRPSIGPSDRSHGQVPESSDGITAFPPLAEAGFSQSSDQDHLTQTASAQKRSAVNSAYHRAQRLASRVRRPSYFTKRRHSLSAHDDSIPGAPVEPFGSKIELSHLSERAGDEDGPGPWAGPYRHESRDEASRIVRSMTVRDPVKTARRTSTPPASGYATPHGQEDPLDYVERPSEYRLGVLANLLRLYQQEESLSQSQSESTRTAVSREPSPARPRSARKWYDKSPGPSSSTSLVSLASKRPPHSRSVSQGDRVGGIKKSASYGMLSKAAEKLARKPQLEEEIRITVHIAAVLSRQKYLTKLCEALMRYGAPTHRLEEYLTMTARVLEIDAQFLYFPGCMFVSFGDATTHTTDLRLLRHTQAVDLGKLADVHEVYKEVIHDVIGVDEAIAELDAIMTRKPKFNVWWVIFFYGCASASVGPFAFGARLIDMPIAFVLGCLLGILNHVLAPRSVLYANVFELTASLATSFLARAFGSIPYRGGHLFCFPALAQSAIALILPGYIVLCASLELQARNLLAGSVRLVYSIIYSLVLGFGIMLGTAFYGVMDSNASTAYSCPADPYLNEYSQAFPFVFLFTLCLILINQGKWKQAPMMLFTSVVGYIVNFFSARRFSSNTQVANALGAFAIGVIGNLYSRMVHGVAASTMLPAIFVQVPSGLAAAGSLISGLTYANEISKHPDSSTNGTSGVNGGQEPAGNGTMDLGSKTGSSKAYGNVVLDLGYGMVEVSLAITVGLFMAALVVYPLGKRRSGLFSF